MAFNPNATYRTVTDLDGNVFAYQGGVYYDKYNNSFTSIPPSKEGYVAPGDPNVYTTSTNALLPTAASASGLTYRVTDIGGTNGSLWRSNGTYWYPANGYVVLLKSAIPIISPSTCTMGNNGAFTGMTAHPTTYSGGSWVLWPAGGIAAGVPAAATFLWTVFSSTTAGTVFNNVMPSSGFPTPPTSTTPFVTTGPGSVMGNTSATILLTVQNPGGAMGPNGKLRISLGANYTNSSGTKTFSAKISTTTLLGLALTTTAAIYYTLLVSNAGAQNVNKVYSAQGAGGTNQGYSSIDTSVAQNITFNITDNTATDNFVLDDVLIELISDGT